MARVTMRFDVFGREVCVQRDAGRWSVFDIGPEGKRRPARDIRIPCELDADEIQRYLDDLCHESATARNPAVVRRG